MARKIPKWLKDFFEESEQLKDFDSDGFVIGTINKNKVKVQAKKIYDVLLYRYKVNDYKLSPLMTIDKLKNNLSIIKKGDS